MSAIPKFAYKLRPGYKSKELLIDFDIPKSADELQKVLISILEQNGFQFKNLQDLWMNDEYLLEFTTPNGSILFSRDVWDLFFILGQENQLDIKKIDELLQEHPDFKKLEVDFDLYK